VSFFVQMGLRGEGGSPPAAHIISHISHLISTNIFAYRLSLSPTSSQDIVCPEAVKIDDLDPAAVTANFEAAKSRANAAAAGSADAAEAMIEVEVNRAMGNALGLSLS
jgi:hypothetical protein